MANSVEIDSSSDAPPPIRPWSALSIRDYRLLWIASVLASLAGQIRNVATLGGNLCNASPAADLAPPLLVLDARVELTGPDRTREGPLRDFFAGPGGTRIADTEVLTAVVFDRPRAGLAASYPVKS